MLLFVHKLKIRVDNMYILNPILNIYTSDKKIRMGGLPLTGKYIEYNELLYKLFEYISLNKIGIEKKDMYSFLEKNYIKKKDSIKIIDTLIKEEFIVNKKSLNKYYDDNKELNREALFFAMLTKMKEGYTFFDKLVNKSVTIVGMGAIGSMISENLLRMGIFHLNLIDYDNVEGSNIQRQILFNSEDIGQNKVIVAKKKLLQINKNAHINIINKNILDVNFNSKIIKDSSIIISTADSPARYIKDYINKKCIKFSLPLIFAGFSEYMGEIGPLIVPKKTACWECIKKDLGKIPKNMNNRIKVPSYLPLCNLISSITTNEIIKFFTGYTDLSIYGKILDIDINNYKTQIYSFNRNENCKICGEQIEKNK